MLGRSLVLGAVDKRDVVAMMECICGVCKGCNCREADGIVQRFLSCLITLYIPLSPDCESKRKGTTPIFATPALTFNPDLIAALRISTISHQHHLYSQTVSDV
jgi:hypothetical protein